MSNHLVISAIGHDQPGIVNSLSQVIHNNNCSIKDCRMTILGGEFAVIMLVSGNWNTIAKLETGLQALQLQLGLTIQSRQTQPKPVAQNVLPYSVDVVCLDHPGIVHKLAGFFSDHAINIHDLITSSYSAAHSGSPMFSVHIEVDIPGEMHIAAIREEFMTFCDNLNLDAGFEPSKL